MRLPTLIAENCALRNSPPELSNNTAAYLPVPAIEKPCAGASTLRRLRSSISDGLTPGGTTSTSSALVAVPYGVVTDTSGEDAVSIPLQSGDTVGPDSTFGYPVSVDGSAAWRSADGVDAYLGFRFFDPRTGLVDYGYAHLVTGPGASGFPATITGYAYDRRGQAITIP